MKTNKSYTKRLKLTKSGKVLSRGRGQNHFNAKARREDQLKDDRLRNFPMTNKNKSRFLPRRGNM